jgi:hypothetical protein
VKYRDWEFEVNKELTLDTYNKVLQGGAEECICGDCKNYLIHRENIFPTEVKELFYELGVDYKKDVEVFTYFQNEIETQLGGWFHFKGRIIRGVDYRNKLVNGGYSIDFTDIGNNFSIAFGHDNALTYFEDKDGLVQIEFISTTNFITDKLLQIKP